MGGRTSRTMQINLIDQETHGDGGMNYYKVLDRKRQPVALYCALGACQLVALHEPRTTSYWDDKIVQPVTREEFFKLHPAQLRNG